MINTSYRILQLSDTEYDVFYENAKKYLKSKAEENIDIDYFTPHGYSHSAAVEAIVNMMLKNCSNLHMSELEKFLLLASIWTHDLGMIGEIAKRYYDECKDSYGIKMARNDHDRISAWHLLKEYRAVFLGGCHEKGDDTKEDFRDRVLESYVDVINLIIKYHRRKTDIEECPDEVYLGEERIRCRLLACFLRLGDTLNIDSSRYDPEMYDRLLFGDFNRESRLHWLKSCVISNIYLDAQNQQVIANIHLPESSNCMEQRDAGEKANKEKEDERNLKELIKRDIDEDLIAVRETFRRYALPIYVKTEIIVSRIPGFKLDKRSDIEGILSDLDLASSPNSSRVIDKSLESIKHLSAGDTYQYQKFYYQLDQLIRYLKSVHKDKPCHVGLKRIIDEMDSIFKELPTEDSANVKSKEIECRKRKLKELVAGIEEKRKNAKEDIITPNNVRFLDDVKNIFLFGYSAMVKDFLKKHTEESEQKIWKDDNVYVFECAGKRRFSAENCMEYNDGIYYASQIRDLGFRNVNVVPDIEFATILSEYLVGSEGKKGKCQITGSNSVVLFGANGIDTFLFNVRKSGLSIKNTDVSAGNYAVSDYFDEIMLKELNIEIEKYNNVRNIEIEKYNNVRKTHLEPIDPKMKIKEELCTKWVISDGEMKYIIKKKNNVLQVYVGTDCNESFEICKNHEESLNKSEISESLKNDFEEKDHALSYKSKFEERPQDTWYILDDFEIHLKEDRKIKICKNNKPLCCISGNFLDYLKKANYCDDLTLGTPGFEPLKDVLKNKLQVSNKFNMDDFKIKKIEDDEWSIEESDKSKLILKDCTRIKVYRDSNVYCSLDMKFCKWLSESAKRGQNQPPKAGDELLCRELKDALEMNKLHVSGSSRVIEQSAAEGCPDAPRCWTIDNIQKELYMIRKEKCEKGEQELSVYRLDKGPCGHSSGHLMLACIAKLFNIPVIVIADSFKKGRIKWNLSAQREGKWLTTQKNFIDDLDGKDGKCSRGAEIKQINYREDRIPEELIARIISEDAPPIADIEDLTENKSYNESLKE